MKNPWKIKSSKQVYSNPWITIREDEVLDPSGKDGIYGVVSFKNIAVGVVPIDEDGFTYLVGQYRYPLNRYSWEIPEGGCPNGEDPLSAGERELKEETGIEASQWEELLQIHTSNSVCDEFGYVYIAKGLSFSKANPESCEELQVKKIKVVDAVKMVMNNEITDSISVAALLKLNVLMG